MGQGRHALAGCSSGRVQEVELVAAMRLRGAGQMAVQDVLRARTLRGYAEDSDHRVAASAGSGAMASL